MKILLDTHMMIDLLVARPVSEVAKKVFLNPNNALYFSAASYWEICIKISIGKLSLVDDWIAVFEHEMQISHIQWLPLTKAHLQGLINLPFLHRDPFDRVLIAQAKHENLTLLTADSIIHQYDVISLW